MNLVSRLQSVTVKRIPLMLLLSHPAIISPSAKVFAQHFELKLLGSYHTGVFALGARYSR